MGVSNVLIGRMLLLHQKFKTKEKKMTDAEFKEKVVKKEWNSFSLDELIEQKICYEDNVKNGIKIDTHKPFIEAYKDEINVIQKEIEKKNKGSLVKRLSDTISVIGSEDCVQNITLDTLKSLEVPHHILYSSKEQ